MEYCWHLAYKTFHHKFTMPLLNKIVFIPISCATSRFLILLSTYIQLVIISFKYLKSPYNSNSNKLCFVIHSYIYINKPQFLHYMGSPYCNCIIPPLPKQIIFSPFKRTAMPYKFPITRQLEIILTIPFFD